MSNTKTTEPLELTSAPGSPEPNANGQAIDQDAATPAFDPLPALDAANETAYQWDFASDKMVWADNAVQQLEVTDPGSLNSGAAFHQLIDAEFASPHYDAIRSLSGTNDGDELRYSIQYKFRPNGRRSSAVLWVENHGQCIPGPLGKPAFARGIIRVINNRYQEEQRLLYLSRHDELTGHLNRIALNNALEEALAELKKEKGAGAFIMVAVTNLSHVNEVYGFDIGDEMIQIVGMRLRSGLRDGDAIGRYSSNKFGLLLRHSGPDELKIIAQRFHDSIRDSVIESSAGALSTGICQGCILLPQQADTVPLLLSRSLEALERAKASPSDAISIYEHCEQRESQRRKNIAMADRIIRALNERRMILALQPIVKVADRKPAYYEALVRMREPNGDIVAAGEFIPIAECLGLVRLIDHRVLELCIRLLKAAPNLNLSLNVSGETASDSAWLNALRGLAKGERSLTRRMMVEITETAAITDFEESIRFVNSLKELGCRVAIDDFGAGYSSFQKLRMLDFDMFKIDGSFVRDLPNSREDQILVRAFVDLAQNFTMDTVAEWVTDEATAKLVEEAGVSYMQGFYLGEPKLVDFEQNARPQSQIS
ncbi:MAG TPA: bifunctional diguanylate cyclase/phosphodiesterase [Rhizobiales bacterium]|nr:bifunctional diguanylate cyclase/phosphodiesterase [Hyphomicrobiales bacterium]